MAELQPPEEVQINGNGAAAAAATTSVSAGALLSAGGASAPAPAAVASVGLLHVTSSDAVGSKRQRRPSVRLGDLGGDQSFDSHSRRAPKPWKSSHHGGAGGSLSVENRTGRESSSTAAAGSKPSSKTRPLVNFSETLESEEREREGNNNHHNLEAAAIGSWRHHGGGKDSSARRRGGGAGSTAAKRVRSNWVSPKLGDNADDKYSADDGDDDDGGENSDSRANSIDERDDLYARRHQPRAQGFELVSGPSDTEARDWRGGEDGVRVWLNGLGLGRYAPVFEVHEVDDEVLPMLTLEDLKDMGINAVGSRRKMFCAIQKLGKGFS